MILGQVRLDGTTVYVSCGKGGRFVKELTSKQQAILQFIRDRVADPGRFPSYREIGREFGLRSVATVAQHLRALEDKDCLVRDGRQLLLSESLRPQRGIPVLGSVQAGAPLAAERVYDDELRLEEFSRGELFAVRVQGESMIEAGIMEGDYVLVEPAPSARKGEMVVAYVGEDSSVTVKYYHPLADRIELRPANENFEPIVVVDDPTFRLAGKVVGVVRRI